MIGGVDHIVDAPEGLTFGLAQLQMFLSGMEAYWDYTPGDLGNFIEVMSSAETEDVEHWVGFHQREGGVYVRIGPEFVLYTSKRVRNLCDRDGVTDDIADEVMLVYFYPDQVTFVTGPSEDSCQLGQELCKLLLQHVRLFYNGPKLPWADQGSKDG